MEMGSQYCSNRPTPARHQNDHQAPTVSTSISDKTRTRYIENGASKYFCRSIFTIISKWRDWMKDTCYYIAVWEKTQQTQTTPKPLILRYIRIQIRDLFWIGTEKVWVMKLMWEGCTSFPFLKVMPNWSYQNLKKKTSWHLKKAQ